MKKKALAAVLDAIMLFSGCGGNSGSPSGQSGQSESLVVNSTSSSLSSSSSSSSSSGNLNEPVEITPEYGSMGSVTIAGTEYDIATTTKLVLSKKGLTKEDVKQVGKLTKLTELDLSQKQISDAYIVWLKEQLPDCYISIF